MRSHGKHFIKVLALGLFFFYFFLGGACSKSNNPPAETLKGAASSQVPLELSLEAMKKIHPCPSIIHQIYRQRQFLDLGFGANAGQEPVSKELHDSWVIRFLSVDNKMKKMGAGQSNDERIRIAFPEYYDIQKDIDEKIPALSAKCKAGPEKIMEFF